MTVYIGSIFIVIIVFGALFYKIEVNSYNEKVFNKLRSEAFKITSAAIDAQMSKKEFKVDISKNIDYMLLDKNKKFLGGTFKEKIEISKDFFIKNNNAYYIDKGAKGHLNISYVIVKDKNYTTYLQKIYKKITIIFLTTFIFLMSVGWYLGRLFLKPMKERIKELDRFIKDSTHELNTPITSLLLATQKIEQKGMKLSYLKTLKMSSKLISKIYQDMSFLSFNQHIKSEKRYVEVSKAIEDSLEFFSLIIEQKSLKIKKELNSCKIKADPDHIDMLIKNLIDNAIKYAKPNSCINIILSNCSFIISNEGKTINKDEISQIFKRYKRFDKATGGFGIGLNIVLTISKKYNFKIDVESKNSLTIFKIYFK